MDVQQETAKLEGFMGGFGISSDASPAEPTAPDPEPTSDPAEPAPPAESTDPAAEPAGAAPEGDDAGDTPADAAKPGDYAWLLEQYNTLLAKTGAPPATDEADLDGVPAPQGVPKNAVPGEMPPVAFEISEEESEAAGFMDREAAQTVLQKVASAAVAQSRQWFEQQANMIVLKGLGEAFAPMYAAQQFYDAHPGLEKFGALVNHTIGQIRNTNPGLTPRQLMAEVERVVEPLVEKAGHMAKALDATTRGNPPRQKISGGGGEPVRGAKVVSATEDIINRMGKIDGKTADDPELRRLGII